MVPYRGAVRSTLQDILGGLRSTCTYAGAQRLKHLSKCTTFIPCYDTHNRVYEQGATILHTEFAKNTQQIWIF